MRSHIHHVWETGRKPVIGLAVALHFAIGLACFARTPSALRELPGLSQLTDFYIRHDFPQTWRMFAPPSQTIDEIGYALKFEGGWSQLLRADDFVRQYCAGGLLAPRGCLRLSDQFRHPMLKNERLDKDDVFYRHYFQQLSAYFCFGDGAISGLRAIRFYSIARGVAPFFEKDDKGRALPHAKDFDHVIALYQRSCEDR